MEDVPLTPPSPRFPPAWAGVVVIAALFLGCGGPISPDEHLEVVLLDTSVNLVEGVTCYVGYVGADFGGVTGRTVAISVTWLILHPERSLLIPMIRPSVESPSSESTVPAAATST